MSKYIKCPNCELNYILEHEKCCKVCDPKMHGKLISDAEQEYEAYRNAKLEENNIRKQSMETYYAYRYNRSPKC